MSSKGDKPIRNYLLDFGLTDKEATCYLTLLKSGPNTIMNLSRETGIKRSTTHNTVEELIKKGLISQTNYGERRMIVAEDPEKLKFLMEQKKWDIKKLEENMPDIVKTIYNIVPKVRENTEVEVKYYKGIQEIKYLYDLSFKSEKYFSFADLEKYYKVFPNSVETWTNSFHSNPKREAWDIIIDSKVSREIVSKINEPKYHTKFLKIQDESDMFMFSDYIIFDDYLAIVQLDPENLIATLIKSKHISLSFKALHKAMWNLIG